MRERATPSLMTKALGWLAQREYSSSELKNRLERWLETCPSAGGPSEVAQVLQALRDKGYLSDERFVQSRLRLRSARFGNRRIEQELRVHGASLDAPTRQHLQDTEYERAWQVWQQRFGRPQATQPASVSERARQQRFLAARGFTAQTIARVIKNSTTAAQEPDGSAPPG